MLQKKYILPSQFQQKLKDPTRHVGNESLSGKSPAAARRGIGGIRVPSIKGRKPNKTKTLIFTKV